MLSDLRFALRLLFKSPGFSIIAVLTLAFAIGVNTAVFSLVHALLFQAPAYPRPTQIVQLFSQDVKDPKTYRAFSYPTYRDICEQNTVFDGVLAHKLAMIGVGEKADSRRAFADMVSANYFSVLGVAPRSGRAFLPEEEPPGSSARVAIASYSYWQKHGRDPNLLGSSTLINGHPFTIVGIMPEGFTGTKVILSPDLWLPLGVYDQISNNFQTEAQNSLGDRSGHQLLLIGRLKQGVTATLAGPALKGLAANLEKAFPVEQKDQTFTIAPLSRLASSPSPDAIQGKLSMLGTLLLTMAAMVLLVACLNLANMLLARGTARRKEIALRLALGAHRSRIVRQLLTEGIVLALTGGVFGLLLALWSSHLLVASLGAMLPIDLVWRSGPNPAVLAATFAFCVLGTLCFSLGPALKISRSGAIADLKEHPGDDAVRRHWKFLPRNPLVVAQIAFSLALLTAAALFTHGAIKAASVDTGLHIERTFLVEVDAALGGYDRSRMPGLYRALHDRLTTLPGVEHASISATVPFGIIDLSKTVRRDGPPPPADARPATAAEGLGFDSIWNSVGEDYFTTVGLPLLRGRAFTEAEATQPGGPAVAIIDDVLAKKLWPNGDALGQRIQFASSDAERAKQQNAPGKEIENGEIKPGESIEVVGIAPATRHDLFEIDGKVGAVYLPFARGVQSNIFFVVKFSTLAPGTEPAVADLLRATVRAVDPALPVLSLKTFAQHVESNVDLWLVRAGAALFSIFGCLALGLSVVGVYGVRAYTVARRTREIGIRMALGARPETVQWMFLREGSVMLGAGLIIGLLLALGTGKVVSGLLYEVGALDPVAFTIAPLLLAAAALLATWLPARRAARVDPMVALRTE
jgi:predicted permease